jgi:predicted DNA-binding transcriptional regulator AlpA
MSARERLIRIEDVAELTGVSVNTLRYWRHSKTGPKSAKFGRRIVYREADVIAWIDQQFENAG